MNRLMPHSKECNTRLCLEHFPLSWGMLGMMSRPLLGMKTGPSHGGESWGRHSMRHWGGGACTNSRSCSPFLRGSGFCWISVQALSEASCPDETALLALQ